MWEVVSEMRGAAPQMQEGFPETQGIVPQMREVVPEMWEVAPETREVAPETREVAPETREVAPETQTFRQFCLFSRGLLSGTNLIVHSYIGDGNHFTRRERSGRLGITSVRE